MKKIKAIYKFILVFGLIGVISCTDGFEEMNVDPNSFVEAPVENIFTGVVKNTLDLVGGEMNDQMFMNYASYYGGKGGQFPKFYYTESGVDTYWRKFFVSILKNTQEIIDIHGADPAYKNRVHIAKIWKSYTYSVMVSTFGGVPMSEALAGGNVAKYDTEEQIYTEILTLLKEAGEGIDPAADKLSKDPVFNGDNNLWKKFANTLRLKIALRISTGFPALAQEHGAAVMANEAGLISSITDNAGMRWGIDEANWSYNYRSYVFGNPSLDVIPYINFHYLLNLKTYKDPRMSVLVDPSAKQLMIQDTLLAKGSTTTTVVVKYGIPMYGKTLATSTSLAAWNLNGNQNILNSVNSSDYSRPSAKLFFAQDMRFNILTLAETNLMKAEAKTLGWGGAKTAEEYYYAGIDASFIQLGLPVNAAYKALDGIKWGTAFTGDRDLFGVVTSGITADPLDKIYRQLWIAMYGQGHDAWCLQKRTRMLPMIPHFAADPTAGKTYLEIPERMIYPTSERGINKAGYTEAVAALGGNDNMYSPILMNKPSLKIDWEKLPAVFNQDFAHRWYGNSEDDLIAKGIPYTIVK